MKTALTLFHLSVFGICLRVVPNYSSDRQPQAATPDSNARQRDVTHPELSVRFLIAQRGNCRCKRHQSCFVFSPPDTIYFGTDDLGLARSDLKSEPEAGRCAIEQFRNGHDEPGEQEDGICNTRWFSFLCPRSYTDATEKH